MTKILALVATFVVLCTSAFAQSMPRSYDPEKGPPPAARPVAAVPVISDKAERPAPKAAPNQREEAQKRLSAWQKDKEQCYLNAGLQPSEFRPNPADPTKMQIADKVWTRISPSDERKLEACR